MNDFVVARRASGQIIAEVAVDGELFVRLAGDGLAVATPIGSSAYSMAAGGPLLAANTPAFVCTPVAMHGGSAPPLVVPAHASLTVEVQVGYAGFGVEIDGHRRPVEATSFRLTCQENKVKLVTFSPSSATLGTLRRRGLIADSPRVLARDRGQQAVGRGQLPWTWRRSRESLRRLRTETTAMLPIPRTLSLDHLRESLAALFDTLN